MQTETKAAPHTPRRNSKLSRLEKEQLTTVHFKQIIRDLGLKVTHQRLVILEKILQGRDHVTAQEVFESVSEISPEIGFATVYRFLRSLSENGFVTELRMKGLPARYEWADKKHHDHMTCVNCGAIREFENQQIESLQIKIAEELGFVLTDHVMELYGVCPVCQRKSIETQTKNGEILLPRKYARKA